MKNIIALVLLIGTLSSCTESYEKLDFNKLNQEIKYNTDIVSPADLALYVYNYPSEEGRPKVQISSIMEDNNMFKITLIDNYPHDDAVCGEKYIIKAKRENKTWTIFEILHNWHCCPGRGGFESWGTALCP